MALDCALAQGLTWCACSWLPCAHLTLIMPPLLQLERVQGALRNALLSAAAAAVVAGGAGPQGLPLLAPPPAHAGISGNAVTNAKAILRYALPIDCKPIRQIQRELEAVSEDLRIPGAPPLLSWPCSSPGLVLLALFLPLHGCQPLRRGGCCRSEALPARGRLCTHTRPAHLPRRLRRLQEPGPGGQARAQRERHAGPRAGQDCGSAGRRQEGRWAGGD